MSRTGADSDVVRRPDEAARLAREPLLVLEPLEAFLDAAGLGAGPVEALPLGDGHSNVTYGLRRGDLRLVLRRPPRGPLPRSAHDVLREARLLTALGPTSVRVPEILAVCEHPAVIGAPFYVMPFIDGHVLSTNLPRALDARGDRAAIGPALVDALVELHAVDATRPELAGLGRADGYLERQIRRFGTLLDQTATRALPDLVRVAGWLQRCRPTSPPTTVVHGDYRLGNVMFAAQAPPRVAALLDWELATLGDPLADLGYLTAMWADPDDPANPMLDLCSVTRLPGFAPRRDLVRRYVERTGLGTDALAWYEVLALWKSAIFLEGSYRRHVAGTTDDPYFAGLAEGVPALARLARLRASQA